MREPVKDRIRLQHIQESINNIFSFTNDKTPSDLETDKMLYYAVVKNLEIIGEAAYRLTTAFRKRYSATEWDNIIRLRHILVHDYYQINLRTVWDIISNDLTPLQKQVASYINQTDWTEWEKNERAIIDSAVHKNLVQTALRMKSRGYEVREISKITGLSQEEIDSL